MGDLEFEFVFRRGDTGQQPAVFDLLVVEILVAVVGDHLGSIAVVSCGSLSTGARFTGVRNVDTGIERRIQQYLIFCDRHSFIVTEENDLVGGHVVIVVRIVLGFCIGIETAGERDGTHTPHRAQQLATVLVGQFSRDRSQPVLGRRFISSPLRSITHGQIPTLPWHVRIIA